MSKTTVSKLFFTIVCLLPTCYSLAQQQVYIKAKKKRNSNQYLDNNLKSQTAATFRTEQQMIVGNARLTAICLSDFPHAENVRWLVQDSICEFYFTINDIKTRAVYNNDGVFAYAVTNYPANSLPKHVSKLVKAHYKNYKVFTALEIKSPESKVFQVILENEQCFLTVQLLDNDEFETIKTVVKGIAKQ
jgi:hypothetical protein